MLDMDILGYNKVVWVDLSKIPLAIETNEKLLNWNRSELSYNSDILEDCSLTYILWIIESSRIRELQQENIELQTSVAEYQSALELIMAKYREQVRAIYNPEMGHIIIIILSALCRE